MQMKVGVHKHPAYCYQFQIVTAAQVPVVGKRRVLSMQGKEKARLSEDSLNRKRTHWFKLNILLIFMDIIVPSKQFCFILFHAVSFCFIQMNQQSCDMNDNLCPVTPITLESSHSNYTQANIARLWTTYAGIAHNVHTTPHRLTVKQHLASDGQG
jgi:hypothetical protein